MRRRRKCFSCRDYFWPDPRSYRPTGNPVIYISPQHFCSKTRCQRFRDRRSRRAYIRKNPLYREKCLQSARRWRKRNSEYWKHYRRTHPLAVKRNRGLQRRRDADLANNSSIGSLHAEKLKRIENLIYLANNNPIEVPCTLVSEEIVALLRWSSRLANINPIGKQRASAAQSRA